MVEVDKSDLNIAAFIDDVIRVADHLRSVVGEPATGSPDYLLPRQEEWLHLNERQRRIAIQIWHFARSQCPRKNSESGSPDWS